MTLSTAWQACRRRADSRWTWTKRLVNTMNPPATARHFIRIALWIVLLAIAMLRP
jgi:hypothetical protein